MRRVEGRERGKAQQQATLINGLGQMTITTGDEGKGNDQSQTGNNPAAVEQYNWP
jgi:hypothetical protein